MKDYHLITLSLRRTKPPPSSCFEFSKMALLGLGLGLGRGLLSLAGVGFVFYLGRKVQHFERRLLELQEEKEELKDLHTEILQQAEQIKESFYVAEVQKSEYEVLHQETSEALFFAQLQNVQLELRENELGRNVEALEKQVQGLKVDNENLLELYRTVFQGGEIMNEKLFLAEKQVEEYAILNIEASKDFELLQRMMEHELTKHYQGDERSLPQSEISKNGKVKATGSSTSKYHVAEAPSETSNGRRRLAPDRITSLKDLVRSCVRQGSEKRK